MTPTDATTALPRSVAELPRRQRSRAEARAWRGPLRHYDIVKEATIALVVVLLLAVGLSVLFSSPDKPAVTLRQWADAQPTGFVATAASELQGTSTTATYGQPFNTTPGAAQKLGPISIQKWFGVAYPLDPARSFVLDPLATLPSTPALRTAIRRFEAASPAQQHAWAAAYAKVLAPRSLSAALPQVTDPASGPVPTLLSSLLGMARSGGLDSALVAHSSFYNDDYTRPLMFLGDSATAQDNSYWNQIVTAEHLQGSQWGVMNETGSWPGQPWLWLYSMWYQVPPMSTSGNADILVIAIIAVLSLALLLVPFIPGLRSIPRWIPLHRAIWRRYYAEAPVAATDPGPGTATPPAPGNGLPAGALGTDGA